MEIEVIRTQLEHQLDQQNELIEEMKERAERLKRLEEQYEQ